MTEHIHKSGQDHEPTPVAVTPVQGTSDGALVPISILVAAILVCVTIIYSTNTIVKKLDTVSTQTKADQQAGAVAPAQAGQPAQAAAPTGPVQVKGRADQPVLGDKNAAVTVVEFGDFQCPFCKQFFQQTFDQIKKAYIDTGKVKYVFRHYPLSFHVNAQISGVAAECANRQGKFWEYHNVLYTQGSGDGTGLDAASLKKYAQQVGLNMTQFNQCTADKSVADIVTADEAEGAKDGVSGTPSFFINGQMVVGALPFTSFQQAIDTALAKK